VWQSELRSVPTHGHTHWSSTRCTPTKLVTGGGFHASRFDHHAVRATAPGPAEVSCACGTPAPATTVSAHLVALLLLPLSYPCRCGVVHSDCSGAVFSTAPSCPLAAMLPPHYTRAPLAGYRSSPPGKSWPSAMLCFKCFRRMFSRVSSRYCVCYHGYICMLQVYVSCYKNMFQVFQTYVLTVSSGCCRSESECCITCMLQVYIFNCFIYFIRMLQVFYMDVAYTCKGILSVLHVFQVDVLCVSAVSDVCCKCFIWMLQK
jgi:hypothetical protein